MTIRRFFFRKIFHSVGFVFKLYFSLRLFNFEDHRRQTICLYRIEEWTLEKQKKTRWECPRLAPSGQQEGRKEPSSSFFPRGSLRSWFSDFKNVLSQLFYFSYPVSIFPSVILSHACYLGWPTQIVTCALFIMNQSFTVVVGDFCNSWVNYSNSYSQVHTK